MLYFSRDCRSPFRFRITLDQRCCLQAKMKHPWRSERRSACRNPSGARDGGPTSSGCWCCSQTKSAHFRAERSSARTASLFSTIPFRKSPPHILVHIYWLISSLHLLIYCSHFFTFANSRQDSLFAENYRPVCGITNTSKYCPSNPHPPEFLARGASCAQISSSSRRSSFKLEIWRKFPYDPLRFGGLHQFGASA